MANKITFYCETDEVYELVELYGTHLQNLDLRSKLFLRAALSAYQLGAFFAELYNQKFQPKRLIEGCIESIDPDAWQELESICNWLQRFVLLEEERGKQHHFEGVIQGLTDAIARHTDCK